MDAQLAVNQWLRHLGFDSLYSHHIPGSFSGRTVASEATHGGSIPSSGTMPDARTASHGQAAPLLIRIGAVRLQPSRACRSMVDSVPLKHFTKVRFLPRSPYRSRSMVGRKPLELPTWVRFLRPVPSCLCRRTDSGFLNPMRRFDSFQRRQHMPW